MISDETINKMIDGEIVKCPECNKGHFRAIRYDDGFYTFECRMHESKNNTSKINKW